MTDVPEDLVRAVHLAARATPAPAADLARVHRRVRTRRRRRLVGTAGAVVVLVTLTGGAVPLLTANPPASPPPAGVTGPVATPAPATPPPVQRLLIAGGGGTWQAPGGTEIGLVSGTADEVLSDGSVRRHPVPAGWEQTVALPDGRLVGLRLTDLLPGVTREDGPDVAGLSVELVVLAADGAVRQRREVRRPGRTVKLVGADQRVAYLTRDEGLVAHDLATGREEVLLRSAAIGVDLLRATLDVGGGRVAVRAALERPDCRIDVLALAGGQRTGRITAPGDCGFRLSPDGSRVAVTYRARPAGDARRHEYRLAVYDVRGGVRGTDVPVGTARAGAGPVRGGTWGTAWSDDATVRVVWADLPAEPRRVYPVAEVCTVVTVRVQ
ncbi:hypothetical protein [Micromonospora endolithica]|uniref:WD40 repeat domain-containing protein n=1 Tax=Micromonospora endolithica TaxID=230091 RepID=A0A3A9ZA53_9ACTN|nr:hypothetical protein [Micromonospora endolithica]RKN44216.1 hypothetical protein D7223_18230 [Micromonospora endolithica]TWJ25679.1 hypothetical protein JD76_05852 [Micromonospora endolithica]